MGILTVTDASCDIIGCGDCRVFFKDIKHILDVDITLSDSGWFFKQESDGTYSSYCPSCVKELHPEWRSKEDIIFQVNEEHKRQRKMKNNYE